MRARDNVSLPSSSSSFVLVHSKSIRTCNLLHHIEAIIIYGFISNPYGNATCSVNSQSVKNSREYLQIHTGVWHCFTENDSGEKILGTSNPYGSAVVLRKSATQDRACQFFKSIRPSMCCHHHRNCAEPSSFKSIRSCNSVSSPLRVHSFFVVTSNPYGHSTCF
jgi:hypothetical protein